jgi:cell division septation protein DedD
MARDYKHAPRTASPAFSRGAILPFLTGLALGLLVAFIVYLRGADGPGAPDRIAIAETPHLAPDETLESADREIEPPKPRFDFYTILPEMEVKVPEWQFSESGGDQAAAVEPGAYVLQVGSFQKFQEADRVKASLALQGIVADIQRVVINGRDVWYRVRVGPFTDPAELNAMRSRLIESGSDFMLLRIKSDEEST